MTKQEAIQKLVDIDMQFIPLEWVQIVASHIGESISAWPMWRTMFIVDDFIGKKLAKHTQIEECLLHDEYQEKCERCNEIDEEMTGATRIKGTPAYLYELDMVYLLGIHAVGWDFYQGVWDKIYDLLGLEWHKDDLSESS